MSGKCCPAFPTPNGTSLHNSGFTKREIVLLEFAKAVLIAGTSREYVMGEAQRLTTAYFDAVKG